MPAQCGLRDNSGPIQHRAYAGRWPRPRACRSAPGRSARPSAASSPRPFSYRAVSSSCRAEPRIHPCPGAADHRPPARRRGERDCARRISLTAVGAARRARCFPAGRGRRNPASVQCPGARNIDDQKSARRCSKLPHKAAELSDDFGRAHTVVLTTPAQRYFSGSPAAAIRLTIRSEALRYTGLVFLVGAGTLSVVEPGLSSRALVIVARASATRPNC